MSRSAEVIDSLQAVLTGVDTALSRQWRDEERAWRTVDLQWREQVEAGFIAEQRSWRLEDLQQRALDNARVVWDRHVEKNRSAGWRLARQPCANNISRRACLPPTCARRCAHPRLQPCRAAGAPSRSAQSSSSRCRTWRHSLR
jgi:hypothetical protein